MTTSAVALCALGIADQPAKKLGNTIATLAGVGTAQATGKAITVNQALLTTSGGATAFTFPTSWEIGDDVTVYNTSATTALIFPQSGGAIDGGSTDASVSIAQNASRTFTKVSATSWRSTSGATASSFTTLTADAIVGTDASLGITGQAAAQGGAVVVTGGASSTSANAGGASTVAGGAPGATGVGGAVSLTAAAGGATSGNGGAVNITAGAATANNDDGGSVVITPGAAHGTGQAGAIRLAGFAAFAQAAPAALTVTATLTAAQVIGGLVTSNPGSSTPATYTFPTGTDLQAALSPDFGTGDAFMFRGVNISTDAAEDATFQGGVGTTLVGSGAMASNAAATDKSAASFLIRKTGSNAFSIYRVS